MLNILCCSTRQWNPGDEWIALGIKRLLSGSLQNRPINWVLFDRSPDSYLRPWEAEARRTGLMANSFQLDRAAADTFHLAVAAGTPEWRGPHFAGIFRSLRHIPWLFLGVDHVQEESIVPTSDELAVWSRASIVARGALAAEALKRHGLHVETMPCPSLFAAESEHPSRRLHRVGLVLQNDRVLNQSVAEGLKLASLGLINQLRRHFEVTVFCNYIDEFLEFSGVVNVPLRYSYDSAAYLEMMADCDAIVSTRLHSAFLANSLLKPAIVINPSPRVQSAVQLYPYVYLREPTNVLQTLEQMDIKSSVRDLFNWKRRVEDQYRELLRAHLSQYGLDRV